MNHMQFVFHVVEGFFIGAAAYGLRDEFTPLVPGSIIGARNLFAYDIPAMHGPTRWFLGHSFESASKPNLPTIDAPPSSSSDSKEKPDKIRINPPPALKKESEMTFQEQRDAEAAREKMSGSLTPIPASELPTMAKLLTSVPRSVFFFYVALSSGVTFCLCAVLYFGQLKPSIIAQYRKKK